MRTVKVLAIGGLSIVLLLVIGVVAIFRPNMQIIYKDDVVLWNSLRLGHGRPGVNGIEMKNPAEWKLELRIDGHELRFDEPFDWDRIRSEGQLSPWHNPEFSEGTQRIRWNGVEFFVLDDKLLHLKLHRLAVEGRSVQVRTRHTEQWVEFPGFKMREVKLLFGEPDRTHEFFMH